MTPLTVSCQPDGAGWTCAVIVGDDPAATRHQVDVEAGDLERLHPGAADPEALVGAAFEYLLMREPRESILRQFDLSVIGRYFPEWEGEVASRLPAE
jgi:hypothetical protein